MAREYSIGVLSEAASILDELCCLARPLTLAHLSKSLQINKNRAFRILRTLEKERLVVREGEGYSPGPKLGEWWAQYRLYLNRKRDRIERQLRDTDVNGVG